MQVHTCVQVYGHAQCMHVIVSSVPYNLCYTWSPLVLIHVLMQRIPYHLMVEASYNSSTWKIKYKAVDPRHENLVAVTLELKAFHQKQAYMMFRFLTEDHTFFTQRTVDDRVLNHFQREGFHHFMRHILRNKSLDRQYHFDVLRCVVGLGACTCVRMWVCMGGQVGERKYH